MPQQKKHFARRLSFLLLVPLSLIIRWLASLSQDAVENVYSQGLYPVLMKPVSLLAGLIPLSFWEMTLIGLVLFIPYWLIRLIIRSIKERSLKVFVPTLVNVAMIAAIWFFLQNLLWNINYERLPYSSLAGLEIRPSSVNELYELCDHLILQTNTLRMKVKEDNRGVMTVEGGFSSIADRAQEGFDRAAVHYPFLAGRYGRPKSVLFSRLMSHTHIIGLYAVLSGEANIDTDIPPVQLASTTMHEMAHQRGFAREDEANYIAWVTCMAHPDADFQYSGSVMALIYSMNALYGADPDRYFELSKKLGSGYQRDMAFNREYWKQFEGKTHEIADKFNDTYLKLNGETDGVKSYGRMIDLLLAEYRKNSSKPGFAP